MKPFFRFPELLLPVAMVLAPFLVGNTILDIQLHDTYFVFGNNSWGLSAFFIPVSILLTLTWFTHLLARKYGLLPEKGRWIQVGLTLLCLAILVRIFSLSHSTRTGMIAFDELSWNRYNCLSQVLTWTLFVFLLTQLVFWMIVLTKAIRKRIWRK